MKRYMPSHREELKRESLFDTYEKRLTRTERSKIDELALILTEMFRKKHGKYSMGEMSAVELLGKLGLFLKEKNVKMVRIEVCEHCGAAHEVEIDEDST